jgi:hypothetical protein
MDIEVGKTYKANDGKFWRIMQEDIDPTVEFKFVGANDGCKYVRFNSNGDSRLDIKLISESNDAQELWGGLDAAWNRNFTKITTNNLVWEWCAPDKIGLWAFGGSVKGASPGLYNVSIVPNISCMMDSWRCYLGPVPEIAQPREFWKNGRKAGEVSVETKISDGGITFTVVARLHL